MKAEHPTADFYLASRSNNHLIVYVGDVTGKGVDPHSGEPNGARIALRAREELARHHEGALEGEESAKRIARDATEILQEVLRGSNKSIALTVVQVDLGTGMGTVVNCGNPHAVVIGEAAYQTSPEALVQGWEPRGLRSRVNLIDNLYADVAPKGSHRFLMPEDIGGLDLGRDESELAELEDSSFYLPPGGTIVMATDGTRGVGDRRRLFDLSGTELSATLNSLCGRGADRLDPYWILEKFKKEQLQSTSPDDATIVAIRRGYAGGT